MENNDILGLNLSEWLIVFAIATILWFQLIRYAVSSGVKDYYRWKEKRDNYDPNDPENKTTAQLRKEVEEARLREKEDSK